MVSIVLDILLNVVDYLRILKEIEKGLKVRIILNVWEVGLVIS